MPGVPSTLDAIVSSPVVPRTPATTGRIKPPFHEMHPGKGHSTSSPSFDFCSARPGPALGPDAQKMLEELRDESLRIKAKLAAEQEEMRNTSADNFSIDGSRKMATPKGKVGRFSDIHMAEFRKMDSIAGHPSAFRAQPGRFTQIKSSLKRSQSKARLDEHDDVPQGKNTTIGPEVVESNTPAKRLRVADSQEASQKPTIKPVTPTISRPQPTLSSIMTPTKASLARAASVKAPSQIPTLSHSPSKYSLTSPRKLTKSFTTNNVGRLKKSESSKKLPSVPTTLDRVKSLLRRPTSSPQKQAAPLPISTPVLKTPVKPNLDKKLPSIPATPATERSNGMKHVVFTPTTVAKNAITVANSPSPFKSGIPRSKSSMMLGAVQYPSLSSDVVNNSPLKEVNYPVLSPCRRLPYPPKEIEAKSPPPAVPGTFTFRSDKTINFGTSPRGFGASPGQASVRQVRPSIVPNKMPGKFPDNNKENIGGFPAIPHGIPNKKRRRVDSDDEDEEKEPLESPSKRHKGGISGFPKLLAEKMAPKSKISSPSKKGSMSLKRLNMLARPKLRK